DAALRHATSAPALRVELERIDRERASGPAPSPYAAPAVAPMAPPTAPPSSPPPVRPPAPGAVPPAVPAAVDALPPLVAPGTRPQDRGFARPEPRQWPGARSFATEAVLRRRRTGARPRDAPGRRGPREPPRRRDG